MRGPGKPSPCIIPGDVDDFGRANGPHFRIESKGAACMNRFVHIRAAQIRGGEVATSLATGGLNVGHCKRSVSCAKVLIQICVA